MKYQIHFSKTTPTRTGKVKMDAVLKDEQENLVDNVTIWQDFPGFDTLMTGNFVEGDLVPAKDPKYGPTLYPPRTPSALKTGGKTFVMNEMMKNKQEGIHAAQENKELGIKVSSSMNKAIDLAIAQLGTAFDREEMEACIKKWRQWILSNWDIDQTNTPPF